MHDAALRHFEAGRLADAEACCSAILNRTPREFRALRLLGRIRLQQGTPEQASYFLTAALGAGSQDPGETLAALGELASAEHAQNHPDAVAECCRRMLELLPDHAGTLHTLGNALYEAARFEEAIDAYRQGLAVFPDSAGMYANLGGALRSVGKLEESEDAYRHAIGLRPDWALPHGNLGHVLCMMERFGEAVEFYRRAITVDPRDAHTHIGLGNALRSLKQFEKAGEHYRRALELRPDDVFALFGLGAAMLALFRHDEAIAPLQRAAELRPDDPDTRLILGNALLGANRAAEALREYRAGRTLTPEAAELRQNEGFALMGLGDWAAGWRGLEARFAGPLGASLLQLPKDLPFWRGEPDIAGKTILLQSEQGLGDTLMTVRYVPLVAALGARVLLRVQPRLATLLADTPGAAAVLTGDDTVPDVDLVCPLMNLPLAFGTEVSTIPADVPYVRTPPLYGLLWQTLLGRRIRPRIGVAWYGQQHLPYRSMPLVTLAPLLEHAGFEFHGLQVEMPEADSEWLSSHPLLIDHRDDQKHFADTAAILDEMELVITIDTAVAHLAGALARPVWIMLAHNADFRWLMDRSDTPWYPTARLFRQKRAGEWEPVVEEVARALAAASL